MTTEEIARRLITYCRKGDYDSAHTDLYDKDAVSIEPEAGGGFEKETRGLKGIIEKGEKWKAMVEKTNSHVVSEPLLSKDSFAVHLTMDMNMKGRGQMIVEELGVYTVKNGKIVSEQFFM